MTLTFSLASADNIHDNFSCGRAIETKLDHYVRSSCSHRWQALSEPGSPLRKRTYNNICMYVHMCSSSIHISNKNSIHPRLSLQSFHLWMDIFFWNVNSRPYKNHTSWNNVQCWLVKNGESKSWKVVWIIPLSSKYGSGQNMFTIFLGSLFTPMKGERRGRHVVGDLRH